MKRAMITTTALVAGFAMLAGTAMAHDGGMGKGAGKGMRGAMLPFAEIDTDGDGKITQAELDAHRAAAFAKADTDGNGTLSADELSAAAEARKADRMADRSQKMLERLDANKDGVLSAEEMPSAPGGKSLIERFDTDGDGAISQEELASAKPARGMRDGKGDRMHKFIRKHDQN